MGASAAEGLGIGLEEIIPALFGGGGAAAADLGAEAVDLGAGALGEGLATDAGALGAELGGAAAGGEAAAGAAGAGTADLGAGEAALLDTGALGTAGAIDTFPAASAADTLNFAGPEAATGGAGVSAAAPQGAGITSAPALQSAQIAANTGSLVSPSEVAASGGGGPALNAALDPGAVDSAAQFGGSASGPTTAEAALASQPGVGTGLSPDFPQAGLPAANALENAGSGVSGAVSNVLNSPFTKAAELGLPLAFLASNIIKGPAPLPTYATTAVQNAEQSIVPLEQQAGANVPLFNQTAAQDLNLANNFQISPAQAASIQTYVQNSQNQLRQQIANQGITNVDSSSEWVQGNQAIQQQALTMQVQMVNQLISTAFSAASAANAATSTGVNAVSSLDSTLMQAAQLQVQQDTNFQNAVGSALQSFGMLAALSNLKVTGASTV